MWVYRRVLKISWTGKDYQQGGIEKDWNRQKNSETIQDEEITISKLHNSSQLQLIEGNIEGRRSSGRPRNIWTTDITTIPMERSITS